MSHKDEDDEFMNDTLEDMIRDIEVDVFKKAHVEDTLERDLEKSLYPGCNFFTRLSNMLRLFNIKERGGLMKKSFTKLLELLPEMLPKGNTLLNCNYEANKILCPMGLDNVNIHACHNDCIL